MKKNLIFTFWQFFLPLVSLSSPSLQAYSTGKILSPWCNSCRIPYIEYLILITDSSTQQASSSHPQLPGCRGQRLSRGGGFSSNALWLWLFNSMRKVYFLHLKERIFQACVEAYLRNSHFPKFLTFLENCHAVSEHHSADLFIVRE